MHWGTLFSFLDILSSAGNFVYFYACNKQTFHFDTLFSQIYNYLFRRQSAGSLKYLFHWGVSEIKYQFGSAVTLDAHK